MVFTAREYDSLPRRTVRHRIYAVYTFAIARCKSNIHPPAAGPGQRPRPRPPREARLCAAQQAPPQRRRARLRAQPLVAQDETAVAPGGEHALGVGVAAPAGVAFGRDQHMLAERG